MKTFFALLLVFPLMACAHGPHGYEYRGNDAAAFIGGAVVGAVIANAVQPPVVYQPRPVYPVYVNPTPNVYYQQIPNPYGGPPAVYVQQPYRPPVVIYP